VSLGGRRVKPYTLRGPVRATSRAQAFGQVCSVKRFAALKICWDENEVCDHSRNLGI